MLKYGHNAVFEALCVSVFDIVYYSFLERIVHYAVKLSADKIAAAYAVALLV